MIYSPREGVVAQWGKVWWLNGSTSDCSPAVRIRYLPSPQQTANLLEGCHLGWHLAEGWPLWGMTEEKIIKKCQKHIRKKNDLFSWITPDSSFLLLPAPCCLLPRWELSLSPCLGGLALPHPLPLSWPHFPQVPGNTPLLCRAQADLIFLSAHAGFFEV